MPATATTRCLLATAAAPGLHAHRLEVLTANLYAPMDMEVYSTIPEGFDDAGEDALFVYSMNGTKRAGKIWEKHLSKNLTEEEAMRKPSERCLLIYQIGESVV